MNTKMKTLAESLDQLQRFRNLYPRGEVEVLAQDIYSAEGRGGMEARDIGALVIATVDARAQGRVIRTYSDEEGTLLVLSLDGNAARICTGA